MPGLKIIPGHRPFEIALGRLPEEVGVQALDRAGASILITVHHDRDPLAILGNFI